MRTHALFHRETRCGESLPYTELRENGAEYVLVCDLARYGTEFVERGSKVEGEGITTATECECLLRTTDLIERPREMLPVALIDDDGRRLGRGQIVEHRLDEPAPKVVEQRGSGSGTLGREGKRGERDMGALGRRVRHIVLICDQQDRKMGERLLVRSPPGRV